MLMTVHSGHSRHVLAALMLITMLLVPVVAAEKSKQKSDPAAAQKAKDTIAAFGEMIRNAQSFRFDAAMDWEFKPKQRRNGEDLLLRETRYKVSVAKPNRFAMDLEQGDTGASIISDGQQLFVDVPMREAYSLESAQAGFTGVLSALTIVQGITEMPAYSLIAALLMADPGAALMEGVGNDIVSEGTEKIDGTECERIKITKGKHVTTLWIRTGKSPLLAKFESQFPSDKNASLSVGPGALTVRVALDGWKLDAEAREKDFRIKAPKKQQSVASAAILMNTYPPHPLVGKKAPTSKLELLDGGTLDLAQHKGKEIVVLDFWATWCGPCVQALPTLIEVTDSFKEQGVRFYAVNQAEDVADIKQFLKLKKLSFPIALDPESAFGSDYHVQGIPQTVIIDASGKVQVVHVGFSPDMKQVLTQELRSLIDGKSLASKNP